MFLLNRKVVTALCAGTCLFPKNAKATQQIELRFSIKWICCSPSDVLLKCYDIFHSFKIKNSFKISFKNSQSKTLINVSYCISKVTTQLLRSRQENGVQI